MAVGQVPISTKISVFGMGLTAAVEEDVRTNLVTDGYFAAASRAFLTPFTAMGTITFGSVPKDTSEA